MWETLATTMLVTLANEYGRHSPQQCLSYTYKQMWETLATAMFVARHINATHKVDPHPHAVYARGRHEPHEDEHPVVHDCCVLRDEAVRPLLVTYVGW